MYYSIPLSNMETRFLVFGLQRRGCGTLFHISEVAFVAVGARQDSLSLQNHEHIKFICTRPLVIFNFKFSVLLSDSNKDTLEQKSCDD
jgi:hypothetical protein